MSKHSASKTQDFAGKSYRLGSLADIICSKSTSRKSKTRKMFPLSFAYTSCNVTTCLCRSSWSSHHHILSLRGIANGKMCLLTKTCEKELGSWVYLKKIKMCKHEHARRITQYLCTISLRSNVSNDLHTSTGTRLHGHVGESHTQHPHAT